MCDALSYERKETTAVWLQRLSLFLIMLSFLFRCESNFFFSVRLLGVAPHFLCYLFYKTQLRPLLFLSQLVSDLAGGKSALRA